MPAAAVTLLRHIYFAVRGVWEKQLEHEFSPRQLTVPTALKALKPVMNVNPANHSTQDIR